MKKILFFIPLILIPFLSFAADIIVEDVENDAGNALQISWDIPENIDNIAGYLIYRSDADLDSFIQVGYVKPATVNSFVDFDPKFPLSPGGEVIYRIIPLDINGNELLIHGESESFSASPSFFNTAKVSSLIATVFVFGALLVFLNIAKKGKGLFIRKIAGLDALDEAVGRATEMGRPVLYVPGLSSMADIATVASINILGPVAKKVAEYETKILVPNRDPIVYTITHEVVKESYLEAGRPDAFDEDQVFFVTQSQFAFVAAVNGIMLREKPATNLFLGMFWAESLLLAETGNQTGAIQIAGTDSVTQLPFFITTCDYTLIGEELYAASAYLSKNPVLVGTLKAQDLEKLIVLLLLIVGTIGSIISFTIFKSEAVNKIITAIFSFS